MRMKLYYVPLALSLVAVAAMVFVALAPPLGALLAAPPAFRLSDLPLMIEMALYIALIAISVYLFVKLAVQAARFDSYRERMAERAPYPGVTA